MGNSVNNFEPLKCEYCKKDVLNNENGGLVVQVQHMETNAVDDIFVCCDGECYESLREVSVGEKEVEYCENIDTLKNPVLFLQYVINLADNLYNGMRIDERAFEKLKVVILRSAQYALRGLSEEEKQEAIKYNMKRLK